MPNFRVYIDDFLTIMDALHLADPLGLRQPSSYTDYSTTMEKDKWRATVVELRNARDHDTETTRAQIYNPENFSRFPFYVQGEFEATITYAISAVNPILAQNRAESGDPDYQEYFGFPYVDDQGILCGLSCVRLGHEPNAQYIITVIRNLHAPYAERECILIVDESIIDTDYQAMHGKHQERTILESDIPSYLETKIGSPNVSSLVKTIFDETGHISEEKYKQLSNRMAHRNVDNRDVLRTQIPRVIENIKQFPQQTITAIQQKYFQDKDQVRFFDALNYKEFLKFLIDTAKTQNNQILVHAFQDQFLEFRVFQFYYEYSKYISQFAQHGIQSDILQELYNKFTEDTGSVISQEEFNLRANQFYQGFHFNEQIFRLQREIYNCDSPEIQHLANTQLKWLQAKKVTFFDLSLSKQKTYRLYLKALNEFVSASTEQTYRKLYELSPKVRVTLPPVESIAELVANYQLKEPIELLRTNLSNCQHPYIKKELLKPIRFLKNATQNFNEKPLKEKQIILEFLMALNEFATGASPRTLQNLIGFYASLHLPEPSMQEQQQILLPLQAARIERLIEEKHYTFDCQGSLLVLDLDIENFQTTTWQLDPAQLYPALASQFTQLLSAELQKKHTTAAITGKILALFAANKHMIFPLQQSLQIYLNEIAQTYQNAFAPHGMSDNHRHAAVLTTVQELNHYVIEALAQGLIRSSFNQKKAVLQKLDRATLNHYLITAQDNLRQQGKALLIKNLHAQQNLPKTGRETFSTHARTLQKIYPIDPAQSLATTLKSEQIHVDYNYRQIQNYRCNNMSFNSSGLLPHIRIHSNALHKPDHLSPEDYMNQFQQRLCQIGEASFFQYRAISMTYYVYGVSDQQVLATITAVHHYNRSIEVNAHTIVSQCWLQVSDLSPASRKLGYAHFLSLWSSGMQSEIALLQEMALCHGIAKSDKTQALDLTGYQAFLHPEPTLVPNVFLSEFFALRTEGKQLRQQIQTLKTSWQSASNPQYNPDNLQDTARLSLQKLMAFDLHFDQEYVLLTQGLSLFLEDKSLIHDESEEQNFVLALGYAQIFSLLTLPESLTEPFNMLINATDRRSVIIAANILNQEMYAYCVRHNNPAVLLPICQKATEAAHNATSVADIERTKAHLSTPPPTIDSMAGSSQTGSRKPSPHDSPKRTIQRHAQQPTSYARNPHHLFAAGEKKDSILGEAARQKAAAFGGNKKLK